MSAERLPGPPRFVYNRRYIEPAIEVWVLDRRREGGEPDSVELSSLERYRPTGARTSSGLYEYELA